MKKIASGISIVVPVYNSEKTLIELVSRLKYVLGQFDEYEIILVDDKSSDSSMKVLEDLTKDDNHILAIALKENYGQQCAILCGLRSAKLEYTVIIDDDLEQRPEDIKLLYKKIDEGYDVVYGIPTYKRLSAVGSIMRDGLFRIMTKIPRGIKVSSFRIINTATRDAIIMARTKFVYISMEILDYTHNIANINITTGTKSESNYSFSKLYKLYKKIFLTYTKCPLYKKHKEIGSCYEIDTIVNGGKK